RTLTGWTEVSSDLWETSASGLTPFEQLWVNGTRHFRPQLPATGYDYIAGPVLVNQSSPDCPIADGNEFECFDRFYYSGDDVNTSYYNEASIEIDVFEDWTMPILRVASVNATDHIVYLTGTTHDTDLPYHGFVAGHRFLVDNVREALDRPGLWYLDNLTDEVLYDSAPGENPNQETIVAPQHVSLLDATGLTNVTFQGLTFSYSNWVVPATGWNSSQGEAVSGPGTVDPSAVNFNDSSEISIFDDSFDHLGTSALAFAGTLPFAPTSQQPWDDMIQGSTFTDIAGGGIRIGLSALGRTTNASVSQCVLVQDNIVDGTGRVLPAAYPIYVLNSHNNLIDHNTVTDTYNTGIGVGATWGNSSLGDFTDNNTVESNLIYNIAQGVTNDIGGIYFAVAVSWGNRAIGNVIHDVTNDPGNVSVNGSVGYGGWGIYFDAGAENVVAEDNLVYRTSVTAIHQNYGVNDSVLNNILAFGIKGAITRSQNDDNLTLTIEHNIFLSNTTSRRAGTFQYDDWGCLTVATNSSVPCSARFAFSHNLYWSGLETPTWITTDPTVTYNFTAWQAIGEDAGSLVADPMFANAGSGNFTLLPGSPATSVGFVAFSLESVGAPASMPLPPAVPSMFTLQLDPPSDFGVGG
ncbi:MAG: right-handed parallel beta-helix repeat-containing protein, partial [Thermoplasmata archaeon]|nr:right-handed parallel beta-helix repeat-containing protein [Thermoplasmata archaeon]